MLSTHNSTTNDLIRKKIDIGNPRTDLLKSLGRLQSFGMVHRVILLIRACCIQLHKWATVNWKYRSSNSMNTLLPYQQTSQTRCWWHRTSRKGPKLRNTHLYKLLTVRLETAEETLWRHEVSRKRQKIDKALGQPDVTKVRAVPVLN